MVKPQVWLYDNFVRAHLEDLAAWASKVVICTQREVVKIYTSFSFAAAVGVIEKTTVCFLKTAGLHQRHDDVALRTTVSLGRGISAPPWTYGTRITEEIES